MSCDITNGRVEQCKDSVSGLKSDLLRQFRRFGFRQCCI